MTTQNPNQPCACARYSFEVLVHEGSTGEAVWQANTTECTATTQSKFAPGHDAKLRSLLARAQAGGHPVRQVSGRAVVIADAATAAAALGWSDLTP
ncbi:hypothetical protein ACH4VX_13315 [Streptomyces sp. NPDC020731]|uniref:hypothetical protein n=1 Tax=Streptomyces sp. NPDC020731 TaxID=3365085 RepID=UPI00378E3BDD